MGASPPGGSTDAATLSACFGRHASFPGLPPELLPLDPPLDEPLEPPLLLPLDPPLDPPLEDPLLPLLEPPLLLLPLLDDPLEPPLEEPLLDEPLPEPPLPPEELPDPPLLDDPSWYGVLVWKPQWKAHVAADSVRTVAYGTNLFAMDNPCPLVALATHDGSHFGRTPYK